MRRVVRPLTLAWVNRNLAAGERVVGAEVLHGGITAEVRKLTVGTADGVTRDLVLRSFTDPFYEVQAEDWLEREAGALDLLSGTGVPAPGLVAVDPTGAHGEYPSLLMTHLAGRVVLDAEGLETRIPLLARQLVAIHAVRPAEQPRGYVALTTAETVVVPRGADAAVWAAAIDVIRRPAPPCRGRFLHRDFHPGNVLFDVPPSGSKEARIVGVVDWAAASWGPADLDVAPARPISRCCTVPRGACDSPRRTRRPAGCWQRPRASGCTGRSGTRWRARKKRGRWHSRGGRQEGWN